MTPSSSRNRASRTTRRFLAHLVAIPLLALGCSAPPRNAIPRELVQQATIPGMHDVRYWGDEEDHRLEEAFALSLRREADALGVRSLDQLPPAHFLALSGGGSNGAFGAGLLCGWSMRGDRPTFKIVTGVSTGALIAPFAFLGQEYDHVLKEVYTTVSTADVAKMRGVLGGLLSDGMADNTPLRHLVERFVTQEVMEKVGEASREGRVLIIATTHMDAQRPVIWIMGRIARSGHPDALRLFQDVLIASAAIPGVFPPVMIEVEADGARYDEMHADGGVCSQVFLYPSSFSFEEIDKELGIQRERHVYVIRNSHLAASYEAVPRRTLPISIRAVDTLIRTQGIGDLYRIYLGCRRDGLDYRLAFIPPDFNAESKEAFDPVYMKQLFDVGEALGRAGYPWASAPPGFDPGR